MSLQSKLSLIPISLVILLIIATLEFALLLRHKSPYLSDSYFYNHIYYQFQGYSYEQSHEKILKKIDDKKISDIEKNIFYNPDKYQYSLSRYLKRPFYPFSAYVLDIFTHNEYLSFIIPIFISYLGCITLLYLFLNLRFEKFWATFGTALFIGFNPFIDWSTYFLTDTIGAFFWLLQLYVIFKYIKKPKILTLFLYALLLVISLFNREQSLLMFVTSLFILIFGRIFRLSKKTYDPLNKILITSIAITVIYLIVNSLLKQPSLYDSWVYLESSFGYYSIHPSYVQTIKYILNQIAVLHVGLLMDVFRHRWWMTFTILGFIGIVRIFIIYKKPKLLDIIIFASSIGAYIGLIIVPFLSYRYFYPTIIGVVYFSIHAIRFLLVKNNRI